MLIKDLYTAFQSLEDLTIINTFLVLYSPEIVRSRHDKIHQLIQVRVNNVYHQICTKGTKM